jgi:predicted aspartyl protease
LDRIMGCFGVAMAVSTVANRDERAEFRDVLVDTGSELTWVPASMLERLGVARAERMVFETVSGARIMRDVGYALVHAGGHTAPDFVVFGEKGDSTLLGARSLEGLNLRVDPVAKQVVSRGPIPAKVVPLRMHPARGAGATRYRVRRKSAMMVVAQKTNDHFRRSP